MAAASKLRSPFVRSGSSFFKEIRTKIRGPVDFWNFHQFGRDHLLRVGLLVMEF